mgnify:CR=1 FL=1
MARETFKDFLRNESLPAGKENPEGMISYTVDGIAAFGDSSGLGLETNTGQPLVGFDAADPDSGLTGRFLDHIVREENNFYNFKRGNSEVNAGNRGDHLQDQDSFLAGPSDPKGLPYVPQGTVEDGLLEEYSNSRNFEDITSNNPNTVSLDSIISKVDGAPRGPGSENGPFNQRRGANELLKDLYVSEDGTGPTDFVVKASVESLKRNNRFNIENNYLENNTFPARSDIDSNINMTIPGYRGIDQDGDGRRDERIVSSTSLDDLKNIGSSLLLRASGYDIKTSPGKDLEVVESTLSNIASGDLEESLYTQKKVMSRLLAMNATGFPATDPLGVSVRAGTGIDLDYSNEESKNSNSFGSTYNDAVRFTDYSRALRIKTAFRLVAVVSAAKILFESITDELSTKEIKKIKEDIKTIAKKTDKVQAGKLILGQSRNSTRFVAKNYFMNNLLTVTSFNYEECFNEGLFALFGNRSGEDLTKDSLDANSTSKGASVRKLDFSDSPGFWHAVSNSIMNSLDGFSGNLENIGAPNNGDTESEKAAISRLLNENDKILKVVNIIAIIGEKSLHAKNAVKNAKLKNIELTRDPDSLPNLPGHRVGKSRIGKQPGSSSAMNPAMGNETTLAWEQSSVPSMYLLPMNIIRAAQTLNNSFSGENPMHGMLGSRMVRNTYTGLDTDGSAARIPGRVAKIVEDRLDAEYVPFYFHDLRTNEIISFHAFLSQLTDTISPQYTQTSAFGRMDPVQTYQSTTRSLSVGFTVYATNREDFDEMWYKINKLVTMLYPQWTAGTLVQGSRGDLWGDPPSFYQPMSQVIGASPLIRLRVGDVIKSNYSKFGLARTFGIGDTGINARINEKTSGALSDPTTLGGAIFSEIVTVVREAAITILVGVFGSPQGLLQMLSTDAQEIESVMGRVAALGATDAAASALSEILVNGFANPLMTAQIIDNMKDPNVSGEDKNLPIAFKYLNPNFIDGYFCEDDGKTYFTTKRVIIDVLETVKGTDDKFYFKAEVKDKTAGELFQKKILIRHEDIFNSPTRTFSTSLAGILFAAGSLDAAGALNLAARAVFGGGQAGGALTGTVNFATSFLSFLIENPETVFMRPEVNPFVRAFKSTRGRGLAGVMKGINFNWLEDNIPWETDFNARAPIGCNISFQFDVIHDLPPGLDHTGYNRAPLYNVGEIMRSISGDPYEEVISESELNFRKAGNRGVFLDGEQYRTQGTEKGKK